MIRRLAPLVFVAILSACSGGGGGSSLPQSVASAAPHTGSQTVVIHITVPGAVSSSAFRRRPAYVSVNTQSASIAVNGAAPVIANLAASSPACTAAPGGGRICTISVSAPVGTDTFTEAMYATTNGTGTPLSTTSSSATIVAGIANVVNLTLSGVVSSIQLTLGNAHPPIGVTGQVIPLTVTFEDASNATIIGNDPFANPITLTDNETSTPHHTQLSKTTLNSPADAFGLTVSYDGVALTQPVTFSATATGVTNVLSVTFVPQTQSGVSFVDWTTYGYDSQRSGFNPYSTAITPASIANLHVAWNIPAVGATQTQPLLITNVAGHPGLLIIGNFAIVQAYDAKSGVLVWQTTLPTQGVQDCGIAGVSGTLQYVSSVQGGSLFVAAGSSAANDPNHVVMYRLNVASGGVTGQVDVTPTLLPGEANYSHSGVTYANGRIYLGTGSDCEGTATGNPSWRGRVVSIDPNSMALLSTFFTTWGQGGNFGGGGVWAWGGVSADQSGNVYVATGNAETPDSTAPQTPAPPFVSTTNEQAGYAEHLVKLTSDLTTVEGANYPGFDFSIGGGDLDYTGSPVVYDAPCGTVTATQGKGGTLVLNNTATLTELNSFALSVPSAEAFYMGNPAYWPKNGVTGTGFLYAAVSSSGGGSLGYAPGLAAIDGCGAGVMWKAAFGPDSTAYGSTGASPRSAPTVTAGGVVFMGTPCTATGANNTGGCAASGPPGGALWAVDATSGAVLGNSVGAPPVPILHTPDQIRMAPTVDGQWVYVLDNSGNIYALTTDPTVPAAAIKAGRRIAPSLKIRHR